MRKFGRQIHSWRRLLGDTSGISVIETAIVIPILAMLVAGISDVAMGFSAKLKFQQAAARSIEMATASGLNGAAFQTLQAEAATAAGVPQAQVTLDKWLECAGVRQISFDGACVSGQQVARFVSISINGAYSPMFPLMQGLNSGAIPLAGYSAVRVQ
jgi:hypothetical protein